MTKNDLKSYRKKQRDIHALEVHIHALEQAAERVPVVKDKVQSSMKDFPYTPTHITVDAPDPRAYTKLQRAIIKQRRLKDDMIGELLRLDTFIYSIKDERAQAIIIERYINGDKLKDVAIRYDMTEQGVLKIINKTLDEFNTV